MDDAKACTVVDAILPLASTPRTQGMSRRHAVLASLLPVLAAGLASAPGAAQAQQRSNGRTLVAYLSRSGNTRVIAGQLSRRYGADLFEIRTAVPYPEDYEETRGKHLVARRRPKPVPYTSLRGRERTCASIRRCVSLERGRS